MRSQFDELLLQHAAACGAQVFTQTRVETLEFVPVEGTTDSPPESSTKNSTSSTSGSGTRSRSSSLGGLFEDIGRPVKASYTRGDGTKGEIAFDYLVDASGRAGLLSTKYAVNFLICERLLMVFQVPEEPQLQPVAQECRRVGLLARCGNVWE